MKKIFVSTLVVLCLFMVACGKKEDKKDENVVNEPTETEKETVVSGGWEIQLAAQDNNLTEEEIKIFNDAKAGYTGLNLDVVTLLGKQVVAGTNYMYLAKGYQAGEEAKATYKAVIVYHDLEGKNTITKVSDFDYTEYVSKNIEATNEEVSGGWNVESTGRAYTLFEDGEDNYYTKATATLTGMSYKPVAVLGKQLVAGYNYAVLCFGSPTVPDAKENIYVMTIYEDLQGKAEITGIAYVDLANFNK